MPGKQQPPQLPGLDWCIDMAWELYNEAVFDYVNGRTSKREFNQIRKEIQRLAAQMLLAYIKRIK